MRSLLSRLVLLLVLVSVQVCASEQKTLALEVAVSSSLNLRSGPGTQFSVITGLSDGLLLKGSQVSGKWIKVVTPKNEVGWVHSDYVVEKSIGADPYEYVIYCAVLAVMAFFLVWVFSYRIDWSFMLSIGAFAFIFLLEGSLSVKNLLNVIVVYDFIMAFAALGIGVAQRHIGCQLAGIAGFFIAVYSSHGLDSAGLDSFILGILSGVLGVSGVVMGTIRNVFDDTFD